MISTNFSGDEVNEILLAIDFALKAHAKKNRTSECLGLPYIVHSMEVVRELIPMGADLPVLIAGALNDVLENTDVTPEELRQRFGEEVTRLVQEVTNPEKCIGQPRKEWLVSHLAHASSKVQNIKCIDIGINGRAGSTNFSGDEVIEILWAIDFALKAHAKKKQMRAYLDLPYIVHPMEVVRELISVGADLSALMAGALHDVLEDTDVTPEELRQRFGEEVTRLVQEVTNPERGIGQSRKEWLVLVYSHLAQASTKAQNIKCIDIGVNVGTGETGIAELDPEKAKTYIPEKVIALEHLTCADSAYKEFARERVQTGLNGLLPSKRPTARI